MAREFRLERLVILAAAARCCRTSSEDDNSTDEYIDGGRVPLPLPLAISEGVE